MDLYHYIALKTFFQKLVLNTTNSVQCASHRLVYNFVHYITVTKHKTTIHIVATSSNSFIRIHVREIIALFLECSIAATSDDD